MLSMISIELEGFGLFIIHGYPNLVLFLIVIVTGHLLS